MEILYIAHCVPWPPNKGDRIRAFHSVKQLAKHHEVHLACLARDSIAATAQSTLKDQLASIRIEVLDLGQAIVRGFWRLARGGSFTTGFHKHPALAAHVQTVLASRPIGAVILLSSSMAAYAPSDVPFLADWGDVDSEKRFQYAQMRLGGFAQRLEARRMRIDERECARKARRTFLTTPNELHLFASIAPDADLALSGNGVDTDYFNPQTDLPIRADLARRKCLVFVGVLDYFPNVDGVRWFAASVFRALRETDRELELILVGRNPSVDVINLGKQEGITVTGAVEDVRPYLSAARAVIAPLRIARGIQNKVLEALAMGKHVLASEAVCRTFHPEIPTGVICCRSPGDYLEALAAIPEASAPDMSIADAARQRFSWSGSLEPILTELASIEKERAQRPASPSQVAAG